MATVIADVEMMYELSGAERLLVETMAREHAVPIIEVAHLYKVERTQLETEAKIPAFVPVIATRQVKLKLRQMRH
jgi:translation initiation factor 2B subunit (eIF-2B alpha/beta/delta family)